MPPEEGATPRSPGMMDDTAGALPDVEGCRGPMGVAFPEVRTGTPAGMLVDTALVMVHGQSVIVSVVA